jgi:hypothetical protein
MRAGCLVGISLLILCGSAAQAEAPAPHEMTVGEHGLDVRSGPGQTFYVTDHLRPGTVIEVYRSGAGGWLGIRPPAGSYSWVRQAQLQRTNTSGVAKSVEEDVVCRVGSRVVRTPELVCQVRLRQGELVEVLEEQTATDDGSSEEVWCRIAPPAGEFRWVWAADLAPKPAASKPAAIAATEPARPAAAAATSPPVGSSKPVSETNTDGWQVRSSRLRAGGDESPAPGASGASAARETVRIVESPARTAPPSPTRPNRTPDAALPRTTSNASSTVGPAGSTPASPRATAGPTDKPTAVESDGGNPHWITRDRAVRGDVSQLELELAAMVSQEMRAWRLDALRQRVEAATASLTSDSEKARAGHLLRRIREFAELENRMVQAHLDVGPVTAAGPLVASEAPASVAPESLSGTRYDGSGWLVSVHSPTRTAPPYALLNAEGDVLQYVSPSPGLNLHRYERRQVGIYGQRNQLPSLSKPHLTAERIIDLDRHLR